MASDDTDTEPDSDSDTERLNTLSRRELQISELVSKGYTNHRIASVLRLSHKTVETYLDRIFKKLTVTSRVQIAFLIGSRVRLAGPVGRAEDADGLE
ncbi:helix-turn-helix domain-containing protein [Actinophytocola sediminis]